MTSDKPNVRFVNLPPPEPALVNKPWPEFPKAAKASTQSPFRTVLCFGTPPNTVRVIVEGRQEHLVDAMAKMVNRNNP